MTTGTLRSSASHKGELRNLSLMAQGYGVSIIPESSEKTLDLLRWANGKGDLEIWECLKRISELMSPAHKKFFESVGIKFDTPEALAEEQSAARYYRGAALAEPQSEPVTSPPTEMAQSTRKKRVVYRGQVKWV